LRESAVFLSGFRHRQLDGLDFRGIKKDVTVRDFMARERLIVDRERARIRANLERHRVTLVHGTASFVDSHVVAVRPTSGPPLRLRGDVILVATGSYPHRPAQFDFTDGRVYDSDSILRLHDLPGSLLVVGGGVVGCEYACMFAALGIQVRLVEKRDSLLPFLDREVSQALEMQMRQLGVRLLLGDSVASVDYKSQAMDVRLQSGGGVSAQIILISSGRCGNVEALALGRAGIDVGERGRIKVNAHYQTNVPHVYAAGDVIGSPALASTSIEQARVAMVHAFRLEYLPGKSKEAVASILPYGIYTIPECSMAGETEESLREKRIPYAAGKASYSHNARGQIIGDADGFLKLLFRRDDLRLVGVHVIGEQATEIVHVGLTALLAGAGADLFIQTCYNYPTLTELYKYATYDALGRRDRSPGE
jgi:NAD(P) transhydrogenase